jgi:hypothetical protein
LKGFSVNADIPFLRCWVRLRHISKNSGLEEAYIFAIQSVKGRALGFHAMLKSGAHYRNVPLHAVTLKPEASEEDLQNLAIWDCFSSSPVVTVFDYLKDHEAYCFLPSGKQSGVYLFTVDWLPDDSVHPGFVLTPDQNKCGHVMALESGNLCVLPTNRIAWRDGYFIGADPEPQSQGYLTQANVYQAESCDRDFSKDERYFY